MEQGDQSEPGDDQSRNSAQVQSLDLDDVPQSQVEDIDRHGVGPDIAQEIPRGRQDIDHEYDPAAGQCEDQRPAQEVFKERNTQSRRVVL